MMACYRTTATATETKTATMLSQSCHPKAPIGADDATRTWLGSAVAVAVGFGCGFRAFHSSAERRARQSK